MGLFGETAHLVAQLDLGGNFTKNLKVSQRALKNFDTDITKTQTRAFRAGQQIGNGIKNGTRVAAVGIAFLGTQVVAGLHQLSLLENATTQTNAVLKSTRSVAGQTAASIRNLAEKYESLNYTVDDKVIQSGENLLLTFTNIRKKAFEPALATALDLNQALGRGESGLSGTIRLVGKALNDPTKGLSALTRVGITFSKTQITRIKALQKEGKLYEAQKIVLDELSKRFGGSFAAKGKTAEAAIAGIGDAVEDLQKSLATALFPTIQKVLPKISDFLRSPETTKGIDDLGKKIGSLFSDENIKSGADALKGLFGIAKSVAPAIESAAVVTGKVVSTAVALFKSLPPELQTLLVGGLAINKLTGGLVTNLAGGLVGAIAKSVLSGFAGNMNVTAGVVNVVGGGGVGGGVPGVAAAAGGIGLAGIAAAAAVLVVGSAAYADRIGKDAQRNTDLKSQGLSPAEITAVKFFQSSAADQQTAFKRLGYLPTKTDLASGLAKLGQTKGLMPAGKVGRDTLDDVTKGQTALTAHVGDLTTAADNGFSATKSAVDLAKQGISAATYGAAGSITAAIRSNRPIVTVDVQTYVSAGSVQKQTTTSTRYGPINGSSGGGGNSPGHVPGAGA